MSIDELPSEVIDYYQQISTPTDYEIIEAMSNDKPLGVYARGDATPLHDRHVVEQHIPHRYPFLFIDEVYSLNPKTLSIICGYHLNADNPILTGHFPENPICPGVLQIEAIGQAGLLGYFLMEDTEHLETPFLTHICSAVFKKKSSPNPQLS